MIRPLCQSIFSKKIPRRNFCKEMSSLRILSGVVVILIFSKSSHYRHAISRNTCSTVAARFSLAFSGDIASSSVVTERNMGKNASIPC